MASRRRPPPSKVSLDEQFDAFLKASVGSDSDTSLSKYIQPKAKKPEKPWWQSSIESSDDFDHQPDPGPTKSFLKKKKPLIPPIPKTPENEPKKGNGREIESSIPEEQVGAAKADDSAPTSQFLQDITTGPFSARVSNNEPAQRSSKLFTETDEFRESQLSFDQSTETGQDTLGEAADKSRFFKKLSADAEGTLDYSRMNRELGETGQTSYLDATRHQQMPVSESEDYEDTSYPPADPPGGRVEDDRPATYQGDDDDDLTSTQGQQPDLPSRPNLLANVSLNDTLDTSLQATTGPTVDQSGGMGNTSQLEYDAVQQAYQQAHDIEGGSLPFTKKEVPVQSANQSEEFTEETDETSRQREVAQVWQTSSRKEGESQATSVWDLQPATEAEQTQQESPPPTPPPVNKTSGASSSAAQKATNQQQAAGHDPFTSYQQPSKPQSIWDLEPVSQSDIPPELTPIKSSAPPPAAVTENRQPDWRSGRMTPPTAVGYQTIDQLSPILQEQAFPSEPLHSSAENTRPKFRKPKSLGKTQTIQRSGSASRSHASGDKFSHVQSSGYGVVHESPSRNRSASPSKTKAKNRPQSGKKASKKSPSSSRHQSPGKGDMSELPLESSPIKVLQSVESFASYLREQFVSSTPAAKINLSGFGGGVFDIDRALSGVATDREAALLNEVREWQSKWREECRLREKLNADFVSAQRQWERYGEESRLKHEQELGKLRQQVYILEAKASVSSGNTDAADGKTDSVVKDKIARLEGEIQSQEKLISGYQLENERLYKDMKQTDSLHKATYERLYQENHKQASELAQLREYLAQKEGEIRFRGATQPSQYGQTQVVPAGVNRPTSEFEESSQPITAALGSHRIAELKSQLHKNKGDMGSLAAEVSLLTQKNNDLATQLSHMTRERDNLKELLLVSKQPAEVKVTQERYQQEINVLEKRVRWYVDNQRILDTDVERLRQKDCEINQLNNRIKQLEEQKHKSYDATQRGKDRAVDAKRIKDLERQVREMEQIVRKRNPNSIPSLIWAASAMPDSGADKSPSMRFLEDRVNKLETELAEKDGETSRLLRAMEQQCQQSKVVYEQRIDELESQQTGGHRSESSRHMTVSALENDLQSAREQHRKRQHEQQNVIDSLNQDIAKLKHHKAVEMKSETRVLRQSVEQGELMTATLEHQLKEKHNEISDLHNTVERLQKEKRQLLVELNHIQSLLPQQENQPPRSPKKTVKLDSNPQIIPTNQKPVNSKTRVITAYSPDKRKDYSAEDFTAQHISDVIEMNRALAIKYEDSQIALSQLRVDHQKQLAKMEADFREEQSQLQARLKAAEAEFQQEKKKLIAKYALRHSESDITQYKNEINSLETVVRHLKEDRRQWQCDTEELSALRIRNITLDNRIKALEDHLEDAKEHHTPEMRHFERLRDKIANMEERFTAREEELKRVITNNQVTYQQDLSLEVRKWKQIVQAKNRDIEKFRVELDSILSVLKVLQQQGVTIPIAS